MDLFQFAKKIQDDSNLQTEVRACSNKKEFIKFLKKYNVEHLFTDFQKRSRDLAADYWPWTYMSRFERKNFFK